ncbi:MAG: coiled-coil protein [Thermoplasmatota archaeon]
MTAEETQASPQTTETGDKADPKPDLRNLQDKFHGLLDSRNQHNDLAREAREGRNLLNDQRREKSEGLEELKKKRDEANQKMREHKERRNAYQDQAKALIGQKKGKAGGVERSLPLRVRKLRNEIQGLMERQETSVMSPAKERDLVDDVRAKRVELKQLEAEMEAQKLLSVDLDDTDAAIDELFKKADEEHEFVQKYHKEGGEYHEKFVHTIKELRVIGQEANEKHAAFVAFKQKADEYHNKAMELREQIGEIRGVRQAEFNARRKEIGDVNARARAAVNDPKALEKATDNALEDLKKGGKISLGF